MFRAAKLATIVNRSAALTGLAMGIGEAGEHRPHAVQAQRFWNRQTPPQKEHIVQALRFELSKVEAKEVRQRMLGHLEKINAMPRWAFP